MQGAGVLHAGVWDEKLIARQADGDWSSWWIHWDGRLREGECGATRDKHRMKKAQERLSTIKMTLSAQGADEGMDTEEIQQGAQQKRVITPPMEWFTREMSGCPWGWRSQRGLRPCWMVCPENRSWLENL
jgi:hypothetical protein